MRQVRASEQGRHLHSHHESPTGRRQSQSGDVLCCPGCRNGAKAPERRTRGGVANVGQQRTKSP
ncbi:hypothetical protein BJV74DRAFT_823449 [Russula compacta]|nr:hypothetical protein BJV74DRAFT_823449 [Russula compacta]